MRALYTIGIWFYTLGVRVAALFGHEKARLMVAGWGVESGEWKVESGEWNVVWFHASSLGEFEQARPVLEAYRQLHPEHRVLVTFFSPSGYEVRKNYGGADEVRYLPMDMPRNARRFVKHYRPVAAFFVKYDFWFNYLHELQRAGIPTYLFSSIFRPGQYFFRPWGRWYLRQLRQCYTHIFVQNDESLELLKSHGVERCSLAGDTRFDRVHQIAVSAERDPVVEAFLDGNDGKVLVCGSTWLPDEQLLAQLKIHNSEFKIILAPHVISEEHLKQIENLFPDSIRYSVLKDLKDSKDLKVLRVLIIDNIGLLSKLYRYADVAYIGGGFGAGIHNILEAVTFGKPVLFGPNYRKFKEAKDIIALGGGWSHHDEASMEAHLTPLLMDAHAYRQASEACTKYMQQNLGTTKKILSTLTSHLSPFTFHLLPILFLFVFSSCSMSHYVAPGEHVLHDIDLEVRMADSSEVTPEVSDALKRARSYYLQKPNTKFLGIKGLPVSRWVYCHLADTNRNFWNNYIHRIGQAPVIYDEDRCRQTALQLQNLLVAKGCFGSTVDMDTVSLSRYRIELAYRVNATHRYTVDEVLYHTTDNNVARLLEQWQPEALIKPGEPYDQEKIAAERSRITGNLRESGYYYATPELITFLVDTTYSPSHLSIDVNVDSRALQVYHINNIFVYPNGTAGPFDTLIYTYPSLTRNIDYQFLHTGPLTMRPLTISRALMLFPGMTYRPRYINNTYNSLLSLRNFKYISIEFTPSPSSTDTLPLVDAHVRLMRAVQQRLSLSLELTNASPLGSGDSVGFLAGGNLGIETALEYQHKNLFHGAEMLRVKGSLLFELPKITLKGGEGTFYDHFSAFEVGLDASLDMPVFLIPFSSRLPWQRVRPHTLFSAGGSYQYRYYFERILANTSFGYTWSHSTRVSNQLLPIELTFVRLMHLDEAFAARLHSVNDLRMKYQYSSHFILGARYDYTYSNQQIGSRRNFNAFHFTAESAGNLLAALHSSLADSQSSLDSVGIMEFFGVPFSQYLRFGGEWSRYHYLGPRSIFVSRILLGIGLPYGNSVAMPYEKSFFGGGPTTMRAWQLRRLGPGSYRSGDDILERVGDLQLVLNLEERFPIAGILEGAIFADMGNVWLLNKSEQYPGGEIKLSSFPREIAVGIGAGLRLAVSIATLRVDFAIPLYDPGFDTDLRFRPPHWNFNQIVTNFGINYPF